MNPTEGFLNRHKDSMPPIQCNITILFPKTSKAGGLYDEFMCKWYPKKFPKQSSSPNAKTVEMPGIVGMAQITSGSKKDCAFFVFENGSADFEYYRIDNSEDLPKAKDARGLSKTFIADKGEAITITPAEGDFIGEDENDID